MENKENKKNNIEEKKNDYSKLNIFQKMSLATDKIRTVAKNLKVGEGTKSEYKAVSETDVLNAVKPIEVELGIYSYPYERTTLKEERITFKNKYGESESFVIRLETIYRFVNVDKPDEFIDIKTYGDGVDSQDKAPGKAMTYADKYALLKAYKIQTGEDPDKDLSQEVVIDYRKKLIEHCNKIGLNMNELAKEHKLNAKSKQEDFKAVLESLGVK